MEPLHNYIPYGLKPVVYSLFRSGAAPGSWKRPIAYLEQTLEDLRARGFKPDFILDIGANKGRWTRRVKKIFPQANFLLIEPQLEMQKYLDDLCKEFKGISWVQAGAGAEPGSLLITLWKDTEGSTFLHERNEDLIASGKQREVEIITIDSLLESRHLPIPDLVKLDVQGFEIEALKGGSKLFGETEIFIIEVSLMEMLPSTPIFRDIVNFIGERGYEFYDIAGFLRRPYDGALAQADVMFVKRDGFLRKHKFFT